MTFFGDFGVLEHCLPYHGGSCKNMHTAIVRICTDDGMVIAADGRERISVATVRTDHMQKVFPVAGHPLAYAIFGSSGMSVGGESPDSINLIEEAKKAERKVSLVECDSILTYVKRFAGPIHERLSSWRTGPTVIFPSLEENDPPRSTITHFFFFGYYRGVVAAFDLRFFHEFHVLQEPLINPLDNPIGFPPWAVGSRIVYRLLFDSNDERFSDYRKSFPADREHFSIATAAAVATDYIRACSDDIGRQIDPAGCAGIGGQIHIAKITLAEGFKWIIPPIQG